LCLIRRRVGVAKWYCRFVVDREWPFQLHSEVWVLSAAVPCVPTEVDIQPHEICEPADILCPGRLAAGQSSEGIQIDRFFSSRYQVGIQEGCVTQFVISIVGNVLGHVPIKVAQRCDIGWIPSLDAAQLVVLLPQVCFYQFDGCGKSQERSVPFRKLPGAAARRLSTALAAQYDTR
jgi:hypothetical protein